jgi:RNA polymerase sigma-70 factor (ECF subfamily)
MKKAQITSGVAMTIVNAFQLSNPDFGSVSGAVKSRISVSVAMTMPEVVKATDGDLVHQTIRGNRSAFDELIRRYQRQAVAVSYRLLGNMHDALEATQDAFLKAYRRLDSLQKPASFGGWLMRIVANLSLNFRRGRTVRKQLPLAEVVSAGEATPFEKDLRGQALAACADPIHLIESAEMGRQLADAMKRLPERQRAALTMFTIDDFSQKHIGATLGCSAEAVKWHVFQARKALRIALKDYL